MDPKRRGGVKDVTAACAACFLTARRHLSRGACRSRDAAAHKTDGFVSRNVPHAPRMTRHRASIESRHTTIFHKTSEPVHKNRDF